MRERAWWLFLVVMAPIVGLYLFGPEVFNQGPVFNGIGLSAVVAIVVGVRLHRPSDRRHPAEENALQGSGLGLSISQAHGGLIEVKSEENAGTILRVVLPANT